jgi:hypothetical protein
VRRPEEAVELGKVLVLVLCLGENLPKNILPRAEFSEQFRALQKLQTLETMGINVIA